MADQGEITCSFCGKSRDEVAKIVAGPNAFICDECVDLCNQIIEEEGAPAAEPPAAPAPPQPRGEILRCRLCGIAAIEPDALLVQNRWPICPSCIASVKSLVDGASEVESAPVWLAQAADDLDSGRRMFEAGKLHLAYFFSHEAIEKALSAFLISKRRTRGGTHSIFTLLRWALPLEPRFGFIGADAWTLDTVYVFSRYPFGLPFKAPMEFFTNREDAGEALDLAEDVIDLVRELLGNPG